MSGLFTSCRRISPKLALRALFISSEEGTIPILATCRRRSTKPTATGTKFPVRATKSVGPKLSSAAKSDCCSGEATTITGATSTRRSTVRFSTCFDRVSTRTDLREKRKSPQPTSGARLAAQLAAGEVPPPLCETHSRIRAPVALLWARPPPPEFGCPALLSSGPHLLLSTRQSSTASYR